jgi:hypothetical protein
VPQPNVPQIRQTAIDYLESFDPKLWYYDPVRGEIKLASEYMSVCPGLHETNANVISLFLLDCVAPTG